MHYLPTVQDVLATLPPADQAELLALVGRAALGDEVTMYSNGNSFGATGASIGREPRWPVPPWKFGLRQSDDRGCT